MGWFVCVSVGEGWGRWVILIIGLHFGRVLLGYSL